jgi:hypothetical protein
MSRHTDTPWRVGVGPYEAGGIYGIDRVDGSKQLIAQVYGYSHAEMLENMKVIVDGLKVMGYILPDESGE